VKNILIVALAAVTLVGCGQKSEVDSPSENPKNAILPGSKVFPVTPKMVAEADEVKGKVIPAMATRTVDGKTFDTGTLDPSKKALFYAINKECPCCVTATPFVNKLATAPNLTVVGVLFGTPDEASAWVNANQPKFPVISTEDKAIIAAFGMKAGVYMTLVGADKKIEKVYPGYSEKMLNELYPGQTWPDAPKDETSGCDFEGSKKPDNGKGR